MAEDIVMATGHRGSEGDCDLEDYWSEINDIEEAKSSSGGGGSGGELTHSDDELNKTPDEGEQEMAWLKDAGYGHLAKHYEAGNELTEEDLSKETSSLTRAQAAAVKKRVDTLNATIRKSQKQAQRQDVRDVFPTKERHSEPGVTYVTDIPSYPTDATTGRRPSDNSAGGGGISRRRHAGKSGRDVSFIRSRGGYSMQGAETGQVLDNNTNAGVETLGFVPRAGGRHDASSVLREDSGCHGGSRPRPQAIISDPGTDTLAHFNHKVKTAQGNKTGKEDLPNFSLKEDNLGITRMCDLGKKDAERIRNLALIELTALFDVHDITYTRRKRKKRLKESGLYGVPLQNLIDNDRKKQQNLKVPLVFQELIKFLEKCGITEEGILRVPGSASRIKELRAEMEEKYSSGTFSWEDVRPNDAAGLLKQFLRELPIPLLTFEYLEAFARVEEIPDKKNQIQALNLLVLLLPDVHRETLLMLLKFLKRVVDCNENLMNLNNVAMIMAPNLFLVASGRNKKAIKQIEISMAAGTANIVRMLVKYQEILNTVPAFMIGQIRHQYETEQLKKNKDKSIMKFLGRKDKSEPLRKPVINNESDFNNQIIRIMIPHLGKLPTPVKLESRTTVADIVMRYGKIHTPKSQRPPELNRRKGSSEEMEASADLGQYPSNVFLYEVGGNIGERRLDPNTNMLSLYRTNPNAEWVIQIKPD